MPSTKTVRLKTDFKSPLEVFLFFCFALEDRALRKVLPWKFSLPVCGKQRHEIDSNYWPTCE